LAQQGFDIISGKDGEERLELAIENVADLVITESKMPLMNGRETAACAQATRRAARFIRCC